MMTITQKHIDDFKNLYPLHADIQALSLAIVQEKIAEKAIDWKAVSWKKLSASSTAGFAGNATPASLSLTPCQLNIGYVIFDVFCLAVGAVTLRSTVSGRTIEAIFHAAAPAMSAIEQYIAIIGRAGTSTAEQAWNVFKILTAIYSSGSLGAVFSAFTASLTWWDMILYGVTGLATIVATLATDGAAFVAQVVVLMASFGFLASDSVKAIQACNISLAPADAHRALKMPAMLAQRADDAEFPGWTQIPNSGAVSFITVLPDGVTLAGIGLDSVVYTLSSLNSTWTQVPGSGAITSLSVLDGQYIATGTDNQVYYTFSLGTAWTLVPNSAAVTCVTFLADGTIVGIGLDQLLYTRTDLNSPWVQVPGSGDVTSIALLPDGTLAGIGLDNLIYVREDVTSPWVQVPGSGAVKSLAALSSSGLIVGVGMDNLLYTTPMM